jgi:cytochrome d ubiquinol oxidase subunit I
MNELNAQFEAEHGPGDYTPPVFITYWSFRAMVGAGTLMIILAVYGLLLSLGEQLEDNPKFLRAFLWFIPLPYLANTAGWLLTEVGRFPWIVYDVMLVDVGVSISVSTGMVWMSMIGFTLIYGALMVADIYLLAKYARKPDQPEQADAEPVGEPSLSLVGD